MTKELFTEVESIKERLSRVVTPDQFDRLAEELKRAERDAQIKINQANLGKEERERKAFEAARANHLAAISEYEAVCEDLKVDEHELIRGCMEFVAATKNRADTLAQGKLLADTINANQRKFGTGQVTIPEIYQYSSNGFDWQSLAKAILERGIDLVNFNTAHPEHEKPADLYFMQHPLEWGMSKLGYK